jgi:hypothetical protein
MRIIKSLSLAYETREDRILAAANAGQPDAWSCWLTRRIVLALLGTVPQALAKTSALAQQAPTEFKSEMIAFERQAAIAQTEKALSRTANEVLESAAVSAELAERLTITQPDAKFRFELHGVKGGVAVGMVDRAELQRILQLLEAEVVRAGWLSGMGEGTPTQPSLPPAAQAVRH